METAPVTIVIPTRPQPDTIVAIFLLKKFGGKKIVGIEDARVEVRATLAGDKTFEQLLAEGVVPLDVGGGALDHHGSDYCTTELVARYLNIYNDPSIGQLLAYANRDDKEGKGTLSRDPLDRAFGLSGLIAALNKAYAKDADGVVETILPILEAHHLAQQEHHIELPKELKEKTARGEYEEHKIVHADKEIRVACIVSDKPSMPGYLRSQQGPSVDVVVQKSEKTNHICILTKQQRKIDLSNVIALIRMREAEYLKVELSDEDTYVRQTGRIPEIPYWYYDPATNSLLNGGPHSEGVEESRINWDELKKIVLAGLQFPIAK